MLEDVQDTIENAHHLHRAAGFAALDDFGTGHSSLADHAPSPRSLELDQCSRSNLGVRHNDDVIGETIIGMAHASIWK